MSKMKELIYDVVESYNEYRTPMTEIAKEFNLSLREVEYIIKEYGQEDFESPDTEYDNLAQY